MLYRCGEFILELAPSLSNQVNDCKEEPLGIVGKK